MTPGAPSEPYNDQKYPPRRVPHSTFKGDGNRLEQSRASQIRYYQGNSIVCTMSTDSDPIALLSNFTVTFYT